MPIKYNPRDQHHRSTLAGSLLHKLKTAGFTDETAQHQPLCKERVFSRAIPNSDVRVLVYTSIDIRSNEMRIVGEDAIRVCGVRKFADGSTRGIIKRKRINRVGGVQAIPDRMLERMRSAYGEARTAHTNPTFCKSCGARNFITKKGKECCSALCWKK
jgi:hypothetical protein